MSEIIGSLELEFLINNPEILEQLRKTEQNVDGSMLKITESANQASAAVATLVAKGGFSDSKAEAEAYAIALQGVGDSGRVAMSGTDELVRMLNADFDAGIISAEQLKKEIARIAQSEEQFAAAINAANVAEEEQIGILAALQAKMAQLKELRPGLMNVDEIEQANMKIAAYGEEIQRLQSLGTENFNQLGKSIDKPIGQIERLQYATKLYQEQISTATNPEIIAKYNGKLEQTNNEITRLKNIGKSGFDELGNAVVTTSEKAGKFEAAINRVTSISSIGARVITQLSRQIIGLGVGLLSFGIGAKAIEMLVEYISNLDIFSGRLNQAKHNLEALNEVNKNASTAYGTQITHLKVLYAAATDVNNSIKDRTAAARELQREFPETFANSKALAILNGEEKKSYDELTKSILETARASAVAKKVEEIEGKKALLDTEKQKVKIANVNEVATLFEKTRANVKGGLGFEAKKYGKSGPSEQDLNRVTDQVIAGEQKASNQRAADAIKTIDENIGILDKTETFLIKYGGGNTAIAKALEKSTTLSDLKKAGELARQQQAAAIELLKAEETIQQKVDQLKEKYAAKSETKEDAELSAIITQFKQYAFEIDQTNAKYDAFVKKFGQGALDSFNAKQPADKQLVRTDPAQLDAIRQAAINDLKGKQAVERTKLQIEEQKQLFAEYEQYKLKVGDDAATKLYGDQLKGFKTYVEYLKSLTPAENDNSARANAMRDYLKIALPKAELDEQKQNAAQLQKLLEDTETYEQKRSAILAKYVEQDTWLRSKGYNDQSDLLGKNVKQQLDTLDLQNAKTMGIYQYLFKGFEGFTTKETEKYIAAVEKQIEIDFEHGQVSIALYDEIQAAIVKAKQAVNDGMVAGLTAVAGLFNTIGQNVNVLDQNLANTLQTIGSMIAAVATVKDGISKLSALKKTYDENAESSKSNVGTIISAIPLIGSVIGAVVGFVSGIVNGFKAAAQSARVAAAELKSDQINLADGQLKYNALLREQARTQADISKLNLQELEIQKQKLALQKEQATADYNTLLQQIQMQGQQVVGHHSVKYGGFLGIAKKTKVVDDLAGLSGADYDTLEKLYTEGQLKDATKAWFEQLQSAKKELDDIGTSAASVLDAINKAATGTTADAIASAIVDGFKAGKRTAADFADDFASLMQNAAVSIFESNYLSGKIAEFYKQFADASSSDGGLTPDKIAALKAAYGKVINDAGVQFGNLEKVVGTVTSSNGGASSSSRLSGQLKGVNADQANELDGSINALRLTALITNQLLTVSGQTQQTMVAEMRAQTLTQMQIAANTKRTADVSEKNLPYLKDIADNTSGNSLTNVLRAAGHI